MPGTLQLNLCFDLSISSHCYQHILSAVLTGEPSNYCNDAGLQFRSDQKSPMSLSCHMIREINRVDKVCVIWSGRFKIRPIIFSMYATWHRLFCFRTVLFTSGNSEFVYFVYYVVHLLCSILIHFCVLSDPSTWWHITSSRRSESLVGGSNNFRHNTYYTLYIFKMPPQTIWNW